MITNLLDSIVKRQLESAHLALTPQQLMVVRLFAKTLNLSEVEVVDRLMEIYQESHERYISLEEMVVKNKDLSSEPAA